jgi:hypothetical protein
MQRKKERDRSSWSWNHVFPRALAVLPRSNLVCTTRNTAGGDRVKPGGEAPPHTSPRKGDREANAAVPHSTVNTPRARVNLAVRASIIQGCTGFKNRYGSKIDSNLILMNTGKNSKPVTNTDKPVPKPVYQPAGFGLKKLHKLIFSNFFMKFLLNTPNNTYISYNNNNNGHQTKKKLSIRYH